MNAEWIGLAFVILVQLGASIWWAATLNSAVRQLRAEFSGWRLSIDAERKDMLELLGAHDKDIAVLMDRGERLAPDDVGALDRRSRPR